jgi:hypothetical protein
MTLILYTSPIDVPSTLKPPVPRYEIGHFFVTIYHAAKRAKSNDPDLADKHAKGLLGCLQGSPMFINMHHPTMPEERAAGSIYQGTKDEVHDQEMGRLAHIHVELIGAQRDAGFSAEQLETLKSKLEFIDWS